MPHEVRVVSAHRTPDLLFDYAAAAEERGLEVIIAGAGGAAHLPGMAAAKTPLPVLGVPVESNALHGLDSLLSIVQMPAGVPVGTLAIGKAGAINAALLATAILANKHPEFVEPLANFRARPDAGGARQPGSARGDMTTVGVLGGGPAGPHARAGRLPLGLRFRFLDPADEAPAGQLAPCVHADF